MFTNILKNILATILFGVFVYVFYPHFGNLWTQFYAKYFPCKKEILYSLGDFDNRFDLSEKDFLQAVFQAEAIWERGAGRELFAFDESGRDGNVMVNLIYDYRQDATFKIRDLGVTIDETRASYDDLRAEYEFLEKSYLELKQEYQTRSTAFKQRQDAYIKKVNFWNSKGGAPENVYNELSEEEAYLKKEFSLIRNMADKLNQAVENINALVKIINNLAKTLNINVEQLNTIGESRGEEFTEGEFKSSGLAREINVYEFSTQEKLVRVLAHEFGHALGLEHVEDKEAIMYYLNENKNGELSEGDIKALKEHCKIK